MSVVARKGPKGTTYYVVFRYEGRQVWERSGGDRRAAERLDRVRKKQLDEGTYHPEAGPAPGLSVRQYVAGWLDRRQTRTVADDRRWLTLHVLPRAWFVKILMDDVRPHHVARLVDQLKRDGKLSHKSIANIVGVLHVMFAEAKRAEHCSQQPVDLPKGTLKRAPQQERETYPMHEVALLCRHASIPESVRVLNAMCLLGGLREGEACGRRWRDLDVEAGPLWALDVHDQYDGRPLKTDRRRLVPVHPELARILETWARGGFELLTTRKPTPDDFIVPHVSPRARVACHTRSTYYKAFRRACESAGVQARSLHATRHTFITIARRAGAPRDVVERITHNARGTIVDRYTHWEWAPLCEAVSRIRVDEHQHLQSGGGSPGGSGGPGRLISPAKSAKVPADAIVTRGSIPGASTTEQHKTRGSENRSNSASNKPVASDLRRRLGLLALLDPSEAAPGRALIDGLDAELRGESALPYLAKAGVALGGVDEETERMAHALATAADGGGS